MTCTKPIIWLMTVLLLLAGCDKMLLGEEDSAISQQENLTPPQYLSDGLEVSSVSDEDMNPEELGSLVRFYHDRPYLKQRSILIAKNNKLVLEAYFNGWNRNRKQDLRSASKSFTSALVGIAIDKGYIPGVESSVYDFFDEEYEGFQSWDPRKSEITIEDLLRMRTGLACNDWTPSSPGNEERMYKTYDWVKFILDLPVEQEPGTVFSYCTGAPVTLGAVISNASGIEVSQFAFEYLYQPLGISNYSLEFKPDGEADTGGHIHMTPRDMIKFGQLFLNKGQWEGKQIISLEWIEKSTAKNGTVPYHENIQYGYLWWSASWTIGDEEIWGYFANGNGGQFIFVVPSFELVVVFTGGRYNENFMPGALNNMQRILQSCL